METKKQDNHDMTVSDSNELINTKHQQQTFWYRFGPRAIVYAGIAVAAAHFWVPAMFRWIGFSSVGVTAGSWAAWWESTHFLPRIFGFIQRAAATDATRLHITEFGLGIALSKARDDVKKNQIEAKDDNNQKVSSKL